MEKFSLVSLCSGRDAEKNIGNSREINISNMCNPSNNKISHNSKDLLENSKKRKYKVISLYEEEYNSCWNKIYESNNYNLNHITYVVPKFNIECELYNSILCMQYIQKKLKFHKIGSTLLNNTKMFITWHNLEELLSDDQI